VNVGELQGFLRHLGTLLAANKGATPGGEFQAFCDGLEPFKEQSIGFFAQFLRETAEEYKRTGAHIPIGRKVQARARGASKAQTLKPALKKKDDVQAVTEAAARLQGLYDRATDSTLSHEAIEAEVSRIGGEFDAEGLKAVARKFGITSGLTGKAATAKKIMNRIAERKGRHERGQVITEIAKGPATPGVPPAATTVPDVVVEELPRTPER
jgi:hypothetical protein